MSHCTFELIVPMYSASSMTTSRLHASWRSVTWFWCVFFPFCFFAFQIPNTAANKNNERQRELKVSFLLSYDSRRSYTGWKIVITEIKRRMASRVTQAVRMMSSLHSNISSIRREGALRRTIFSREHFPKFLLVINVFSCYAGYSFMERVHSDDVSRFLVPMHRTFRFWLYCGRWLTIHLHLQELRLQQSILSEENFPKRYDATRRFTIVARHSPEQTQTEPLL